jgi:hypothetical protein
MRAARRIALTLALLLGSSGARATAPDVDQARAIFNAGAQAYEKADYAAALEAFEAAYRITPRPGILFSMAQAHRRQYAVTQESGHIVEAVRLYREYLSKVSQGDRRADAVQALVELEPLAARVAAESSAATPVAAPTLRTRLMVSAEGDGAVISLDGQKPQGAPLIADVTPGRHQIRASAPGYIDENREVSAVEGTLVAVDVALREQPGKLFVVAPAGAEISVDRRLVGRTPLAGPISVTPGRRWVWIAKAGREPREIVVDVERGKARTIRVAMTSTGQRVAANVMFVTAGAAALAGGVFTEAALLNQHHAENVRTAQAASNISPGDVRNYEDARQRRDEFRNAAYVSFGAALGLTLTGAVLYIADQPRPAPIRAERPEPFAPKTRPVELGFLPLWERSLSGLALWGRF